MGMNSGNFAGLAWLYRSDTVFVPSRRRFGGAIPGRYFSSSIPSSLAPGRCLVLSLDSRVG